ncbi:MAG: hypothetical protein IPP15_12175 [Saprospiraceae bacterium]|uniref:Uncharacterized protein n=1 Tax=Candidatus Opimibacter skivensis TaxID=2982028 RepID=A0A9D7SWA8_9BACT|nr:hypothetical protein [Candidatus Opimibacter skivensis]
MDSIFAIEITTPDADLFTTVDPPIHPFSLFASSANSITIVNKVPGDPGYLSIRLSILSLDRVFHNIETSPIEVLINWLDSDYVVLCMDTLLLPCDPEPPCLYLASDSIWCGFDAVVCTDGIV